VTSVLQPAVDYATSKNLYVIVDYHQIDNTLASDGGPSGSGQDAIAFWTQIAPVFSNYPNVIYEAFNEPIDTSATTSAGGWNAAYTRFAQSLVTVIRAGAPDNLIVVGSPSWSQYPNASSGLDGGNIAMTGHTYPGNYPGKGNAFKTRVTAAAASIPVFLTEWGFEIGDASASATLDTPDLSWGTDLQQTLKMVARAGSLGSRTRRGVRRCLRQMAESPSSAYSRRAG